MLKLWDLSRCIFGFGLIFLAAYHVFDFIEEVLDNLLVIEKDIRIKHEAYAFIHKQYLVFVQITDFSFESILAGIVSQENLFKDISENILDSFTLWEKESASLVLDIEEDHGQLFETRFLDCIILLTAASTLICHQDIGDVLNTKGTKVVVAINQLQILCHSQRGLAQVDAALQHVFDMIFLAILREARPQDIGGKLTLMINSREEISQDPQVAAVLLTTFFTQLN